MNMHMTNSDIARLRRMIGDGVTDIALLQSIVPVHVKRIKEVIAHSEEVKAQAEEDEAEAAEAETLVKPVSAAAKAAAEVKAKKAKEARAKKKAAETPNPIS